jgi:hypothetical protein
MRRLGVAAAEQGRRPEINPEVVTAAFEAIVEKLVQRPS